MVPRIAHELADESRARLARRKNRQIRRVVKEFRSHDEYVFCVVQIAVIVGLTIWLATHPKKPEAVTPQQIYQINSTNPEPGPAQASVSPSNAVKKGKNGSRQKTSGH